MNKLLLLIFFSFAVFLEIQAQNDITDAFEDLKRKGSVTTQESEMSHPASVEAIQQLIQEQPLCGYFCFTEDRLRDIRLLHTIPACWTTRPAESRSAGRRTACRSGPRRSGPRPPAGEGPAPCSGPPPAGQVRQGPGGHGLRVLVL